MTDNHTPEDFPQFSDLDLGDDTEPMDPDTLFLSRAAAHVVEANATLWVNPTSANITRARTLGAMWEDLTGLVGLDAQNYAKRIVETQGEVTAHVAPF